MSRTIIDYWIEADEWGVEIYTLGDEPDSIHFFKEEEDANAFAVAVRMLG